MDGEIGTVDRIAINGWEQIKRSIEEESGPYNGIGRGDADRRSTEIDGGDLILNAPGQN